MSEVAQTAPETLASELSIAGYLRIEGGRLLTSEEKARIVAALHPRLSEGWRDATIEECAKFVEQHQERISETSNGSERSLSPRKVGNQMGLAYVTGLRSLLMSRPHQPEG